MMHYDIPIEVAFNRGTLGGYFRMKDNISVVMRAKEFRHLSLCDYNPSPI